MNKMLLVLSFIFLIGCEETERVYDSGIKVDKVCIEGHVYYYTSGAYRGGIAPKLNDGGRPIKCKSREIE